MSESEQRNTPPEVTKPFLVKISPRPEIQEVVEELEEHQEVQNPTLEFPQIRSIARSIAAPKIQARRNAARLEEVKKESRHDVLTGLLNRRGWEEEMKKGAARAQRDGTPVCIAVADIRGLGETNNSLSMGAGDALMKVSAEIIRSLLRETDEAARYGGDEFGMILPNTTLEQAVMSTSRIARKMEEPQVLSFQYQGNPTEITTPIGIRIVVGEIDPHNWEASEQAVIEEMSVMKKEEKALKKAGEPIGGNKVISIGRRQQAA